MHSILDAQFDCRLTDARQSETANLPLLRKSCDGIMFRQVFTWDGFVISFAPRQRNLRRIVKASSG
jgi:hypothetical protein